jgi:ligand-binding sensor domain-containing protein
MKKYTLIFFIATYFLQISDKLYAQDWTIIRQEYPIVSVKQIRDGRIIIVDEQLINWYGNKGNLLSRLSIPTRTGKATTVFEDRESNLWFGTSENMIVKYNGREWESFKALNNYYNNSFITQIFQDKKGNMWFGTYGGGILQFDGKNWIIHDSYNGHLSEDHISTIFQDWQGSVWFGTWDGLTKYDNDTWTKFYQKKEKQDSRSFYSIFQDKNNALWFGTSRGVIKYDSKNWIDFNDYANKNPTEGIGSIFQDKEQNIWFGTGTTYNTVYKYDGVLWKPFTLPSGGYPIANYLTNIVQDKKGNLWAGTLYGISKFEDQKWVNVTYPPNEQKNGFNPRVTQILKDKNGSLWFGTNTGLILVNFERNEENIEEGIIYPNPANSLIEISGIPNNSKISIFDARGVLLKEILYKNFIGLDSFSSGAYFLEIDTGSKIFKKKLIIQK